MQAEWESIKEGFALGPDDRTRADVLTQQHSQMSLDEEVRTFLFDLMGDLEHLFSTSSAAGLPAGLVRVLLSRNRPLILGTVLVILSLSLIAASAGRRAGVAPPGPNR